MGKYKRIWATVNHKKTLFITGLTVCVIVVGGSFVKNDQTLVITNDNNALEINIEVPAPIEHFSLEVFEENLENRDFRTSLKQQKEVVVMRIDAYEITLKNMADAEAVVEQSIEKIMLPDHEVKVEASIKKHKLSDITFDAVETSDNVCDAELLDIEIIEEIHLTVDLADETDIMSVESAVEEITKLKETPQTYTVVSGDVPSIIAETNNMTLQELYTYNPELEDNATCLQIGDALIVMVPEPELTLKILEMDLYNTAIPKSYVRQTDSNYYVGTNKTLEYGADGVKEVTSTVEKVNGNVISRSIQGERTLQEPVNAVILTGTKSLPPKGSIGTFISPLVEYALSSNFGPRWNRQHRGIDMAANTGTSVRASDGGVVSYSGWSGSYGYLVEIDHGNGIKTRYAHNSQLLVTVGQQVSQYQEISKVGNTGNSTGPHLHFEILIEDIPVNPLDYLN